jgi:hypothetical protein
MNELFEVLRQQGFLSYGATFGGHVLRDLADIKIPEKGTFKEFQEATLKELQIAGFIRDLLLKEGKYIKKEGEQYRVLFPSENLEQVKRMNESATRKYKRALLLQKTTPRTADEKPETTSSNLRMLHIEKQVKRQQLLA